MKLIKAHINAFGNLKNLDVKFDDKINTIFHENGYGKTTFTIFLKAMLYGMAKKGNNKAYAAERSHYAPWEGGSYGGSLTIEIDGKVYTIIRQFAQTPEGDIFELIDEKTGLKSNAYSKEIGYEIFGVGMETFEITAFFSQNGLNCGVNDEVRANLTGANKFEDDLASCTHAQKLLTCAISNAKSLTPKVIEIDEIKRQIRDCENLQEYDEKQLKSLQENLKEVEDNFKDAAQKEKVLKEQYKKVVAEKSKYNFLTEQLASKSSELTEQKNQRLLLLQSKKDEKNEKNNKKTTFSMLFFAICAILLFAGIGLIVASFFVKAKTLLLVLGVVIALGACAIFTMTFILKNKKQKNGQTDEQLEIEFAQIDASIASLESDIFTLKNQLQNIENNFNDKEIERELEKIHENDKSKSMLIVKIDGIKKELYQNEENMTLLNNNLAKMIENREKYAKKIGIFEKTKQFLLTAKENVSSRYLNPMQQSFDKLYSKFDKNGKLMMDVNLQFNKVTAGGLKESEYLSQGFKDLLSICKRFALLEQVYLKEKPFLILDDPFVNLDDDKLSIAKGIVKDLSKDYQIIYICSHSRLKI